MIPKKTILLVTVLFSILLTMAANPMSVGSMKAETLDETEIHHLEFIREEEKLAHDVYTVLYEQWGMQIFDNIAESEQRHTDAMGRLLAYYGLEDGGAVQRRCWAADCRGSYRGRGPGGSRVRIV